MTDHLKNVNARKEAAAQKLGQLNLQLLRLAQAYDELATEAWALGLEDIADSAISMHETIQLGLEMPEDEDA